MTQNERILSHLKQHGSITQIEATTEYGCTRLSARIYDLKHAGHNIIRRMETGQNRYGDRTDYARYVFIGDD